MTGLGDEATLASARNAGSAGVVTKDRAARDLVESLRAAAAGLSIADDLDSSSDNKRATSRAGGIALSDREREVLAELAAGLSTDEIASTLHISRVTARNHIQRILHKLGARSRHEAVAFGIQGGIISPPTRRPIDI